MDNTKRLTVLIIVSLWCLLSLPFAHGQELSPLPEYTGETCQDEPVEVAGNTIIIKKKAVVAAAGGGGGASCQESPFYDITGTDYSYFNCGYDDTQKWCGTYTFDPGANKSVCKLEFQVTCLLEGSGCDQCSYYSEIFTMDGTALGTLLGTSEAVAGVDSWSSTPVAFTFATPVDVSSATSYGAVVRASANGDCYFRIFSKETGTGSIAKWNSSKVRQDAAIADTQIRAFAYE